MARDRANIRTDMWGDEDWRELTVGAQHLYMLLLSSPKLNYAGVTEWRPGRLAAMTAGATKETVCAAAQELVEHLFIVVDEDTEEVLIRSFLKHDGLMKQPKLVVSMANAFAGTASAKIRQVIAFEVQKLKVNEPDLNAWNVRQVETVLASTGKPASEFTHDFTLNFTPGLTLNGGQDLGVPTTTATTTTTSISNDIDSSLAQKKKRATVLPDSWVPTREHIEYANKKGLDIEHEVLMFRNHALANDRRQASWNGAFTTWMGKSRSFINQSAESPTDRALRIIALGDEQEAIGQ